MKRNIGTMSIGVRCPIIREGDDLAKIVVDSVLAASKEDSLPIEDKDIIVSYVFTDIYGNEIYTEGLQE